MKKMRVSWEITEIIEMLKELKTEKRKSIFIFNFNKKKLTQLTRFGNWLKLQQHQQLLFVILCTIIADRCLTRKSSIFGSIRSIFSYNYFISFFS